MNARQIFNGFLSSAWLVAAPALAADELPVPQHLSAASDTDSAPILLAGRRYAAFWNTGDPRYARIALSPDFMDRTLPPGRPQGPSGPLAASAAFRAAVPDLSAEMEDVVIAGDRISIRFHFRGHFTGQMGTLSGEGQVIDFQAFDIYRVSDGVIAENWHLEDNLTFKQQLGLIAR
ncbi:ester cyclase [Paucibacter sp. R3-3]|uniref:Ester cyclase n=1 Tax=Roseateles agri TaxID=3098619 RepID=A0ABU5DJ75_9BURK|nr:ester cyclase [Paucibacter sp. R3-3]MDY0746344.1 ester cyclase [Paucibacter sp. R3-3]